MEMTVKIEKTVNVKCLHVCASVRYWEDAILNGSEDEKGDMPCRSGEMWIPIIDIDTGVILNWDIGNTADIHFKVCDAGKYTVADELGNTLITKDGYVPDILSPGGSGYGDYIIMKIDKSGKIENWRKHLIENFFDDCDE
jgi:hypothetical protein